MKSIYHKLALIIVIGFIAQIFLVFVFYRHVVLNKVIYEINAQENNRQIIMDNVATVINKSPNDINDLLQKLLTISKKSEAFFIIKDIDGKEILRTPSNFSVSGKIKEERHVKNSGKISYIIYGYFPQKLQLENNISKNKDRILLGAILLLMAGLCNFLVYKSLAEPIKNLSKAINEMNYGNTTTKIPYYSEDEFGNLCRSFENMGARLQSAKENQQQLIQAISHDVKTPLTSIVGYSKRLIEGKVPEARRTEYYDTIYRKATDLKYLLEELDDYTTLNSNEKYFFVSRNVEEYYNKICDELAREIHQKGYSFNYSSFENNNENQSVNFSIDEKKIQRVLTNIIDNSIKYANSHCSISFQGYIHNGCAYFKITDDGNGVPQEQIKKIFEKFYRVETSRSREKGGTGLGLAICKDILLAHNGDIYGENILGKGFAITFYIPILL